MITPLSLPYGLLAFASREINLENAGGKGVNLGRLAQAGFDVPEGFIVPVQWYRQFVAENGKQSAILETLAEVDFSSTEQLELASQKIRRFFSDAVLPRSMRNDLFTGWQWLGGNAVAVRSSATAEDLPYLSFAGQQDTYLNIQEEEALYRAVLQCWGSLWTARAIGYRARNGIAHEDVALAVIVQRMVQSETSGVLFTANPLTGKRRETVIDATMGLGEALVSGQVEPDHYVVDELDHILSKKLGKKETLMRGIDGGGTTIEKSNEAGRQALSDEQIIQLGRTGRRIEAEYGAPQDIEWAFCEGKLSILQARAITSLFPLPAGLPEEPLQVMMAFSAVQGIQEPLTPLGQDTMLQVLCGGGKVFAYDMDMYRQNTFLVAGERLWINFTSLLTNNLGRKILPELIVNIDPGVSQAFTELVTDERLLSRGGALSIEARWRMIKFMLPMMRRVFKFWRKPDEQREYVLQQMDAKVMETEERLQFSGDAWQKLSAAVGLLDEARNIFPDVAIPLGVTAVMAGTAPFYGFLQRFAVQAAAYHHQPELELLPMEIGRGIPFNETTAMDLHLWQVSVKLRQWPEIKEMFKERSAADLAEAYLADELPAEAMGLLRDFIKRYGMRGLGEIDLGRPRWREHPQHILQVLQSYLSIEDDTQAPDAVFSRAAIQAEQAARLLEEKVRILPAGFIKMRLLHWAITRYRGLGGMRETPKFFAIRMMGILRQGVLSAGQMLFEAGLLQQAEDIFFLRLDELRGMAASRDITEQYRENILLRREERRREMLRKQLPRVLLSDGTAYYEGTPAVSGDDDNLQGTPVSPGITEGVVRIVFDPLHSKLAPGEILVCPGTDPAWTPLFLTAGGLVMEVGGMMTHGSVVAREYGLPAVVGVSRATERLRDGQRIRLDGTNGMITMLDTASDVVPVES